MASPQVHVVVKSTETKQSCASCHSCNTLNCPFQKMYDDVNVSNPGTKGRIETGSSFSNCKASTQTTLPLLDFWQLCGRQITNDSLQRTLINEFLLARENLKTCHAEETTHCAEIGVRRTWCPTGQKTTFPLLVCFC